MALVCSKCSRANPSEAAYCYHDGNVLGNARAGAVPAGLQGFANPFFMPSGKPCRNFDELALACQSDWNGAKAILKQGFLEGFFGGMGRSDLAMAARQAAQSHDPDRGLDDFLSKLPTQALSAPKLRVDPQELNLGTMQVGQERKLELHLDNQGGRLLYGTVSVEECPWLAVGEGAGVSSKLFQFGSSTTIPLHVRGKMLRAGNKPLEGRIVVESNGGTVTTTVRVEVPIKPLSAGVLAGAKSPRQVAEKAKANPKEAAPLFEKGVVQQWYTDNGWTYPVQGPNASGIGAVQQFFEALGLTPPPRIDISERSVTFRGTPGEQLKHVLTVSTAEKRPVYAHGMSDQPWLEIGRAKLNGRTATIPIVIPTVPNKTGETLTANVTVTGNGNQRFVVPVTLTVGDGLNFHDAPAPKPERVPSSAVLAIPSEAEIVVAKPEPLAFSEPVVSPRLSTRRGARRGFSPGHLIPAGLLLLALFAVMIYDLLAKNDSGPTGPTGPVVIDDTKPYEGVADLEPVVIPVFMADKMRFGLVLPKAEDPQIPGKLKRLFYAENGETNNLCVRIAGSEHLFGQEPGRWVKKDKTQGVSLPEVLKRQKGRYRWSGQMAYYPEEIFVTQTVDLVPNHESNPKLDTILVRYQIENKSTAPSKVGLRVMLDTFIGSNDGVPIRIPGEKDFLETMKVFPQKEIPDYIQAWENADFKNPGTVVHMQLKNLDIGVPLEPILEMVVCRYPGNSEEKWKWPYTPMNEPADQKKDSCVVLYWADRTMNAGEVRNMAFTYGLNTISSIRTGNAGLALTAGGSFKLGGTFTVTATVANPSEGQLVTLDLPKGLELLPGEKASKEVQISGKQGQASWRVKSTGTGKDLPLKATTPGVAPETYPVTITNKSIFG